MIAAINESDARALHAVAGVIATLPTVAEYKYQSMVTQARVLLALVKDLEAKKLEIIANPKKYPFPAFRDARDAYDAAYQELADLTY